MSDSGQSHGAYTVIRELGRGGMGVVHLARDGSLDREVAIKTLPDDFAANPERLARFEREARLLASLSHGNIAAVHGLESDGGSRRLVMEYVPGETLGAMLAEGALGVETSLRVAAQIAAAVEAAHDAGVIHRDLKPGNVIVRPDGVAKVLDFGLAREVAGSRVGSSLLPTATHGVEAITGRHAVLGTPGYMSPEQARGKPVDKRTDVFSFGCVLFEMLTGKAVFKGETTADVVVALLDAEPDWDALPERTPLRVRELMRHCLEKDPSRRLRDMGDARLEIERAIAGQEWARSSMVGEMNATSPRRRLKALAPWVVVAIVVASALVSTLVRGSRVAPAPTIAASIVAPPGFTASDPLISPDGRTVVYFSRMLDITGIDLDLLERGWRLRRLDSYESRMIPGTKGARGVGFSPDGRWVTFAAPISEDSTRHVLYKMAVDDDGQPVSIGEFDVRFQIGAPLWLEDGRILLMARQERMVLLVFRDTGAYVETIDHPALAALIPAVMHRLPGESNRFMLTSPRYAESGFVIDCSLLDLENMEIRQVVENAGSPHLLGDDTLLFARADSLLAAPIDRATMELRGSPRVVLTGMRTSDAWSHAEYSVSLHGDLVYAPGGRTGASRRLSILDIGGESVFVGDRPRALEPLLSVSPDGARVAMTMVQSGGLYDIWVTDIDRPTMRRAIAMPGADCGSPIWSRDGRTLYFMRRVVGEPDSLYALDIDGAGPPRRFYTAPGSMAHLVTTLGSSWKNDEVVFTLLGPDGAAVLVADTDMEHEAPARVLLSGSAFVQDASYSHDGRWIVYTELGAERRDVLVRAVREDGTLGPPIPVTTGGGAMPAWRSDLEDGQLGLVYRSNNGDVVRTVMQTSPRVSFSVPERFPVDGQRVFGMAHPLPSGNVLVLMRGEEENPSTEARVILNAGPMLRGARR